jgi:competence protein ComEC
LLRSIWRFVRLNPCFVLALPTCLAVGVWGDFRRPETLVDPVRTAEVTGWISSALQTTANYTFFELIPHEVVQGGRRIHHPGRVAVYVYSPQDRSVKAPSRRYRVGDIVRFTARVEEPTSYLTPGAMDYRQYLWYRGVLHVVRLKSFLQLNWKGVQPGTQLLRPLFAYSDRFESFCRSAFTNQQFTYIVSLFLGREKLLNDLDSNCLRRLGILHVFVVSGSHVSLIVLFMHVMLRWAGAVGRIVTLLALWIYVVLVGPDPPVLRAALMASILYVLLVFGLCRQFLNCLGLSALLGVVCSPSAVMTSSFQLSYLCMCAMGLLVMPRRAVIVDLRRALGTAFTERITTGRDASSRRTRRMRYWLEERLEFLPRRAVATSLRIGGFAVPYLMDVALCSWFVPLLILPVCLYYSNLWVWTQSLSNLALLPLFGLLVPLCLVLFMTFWAPGLGVAEAAVLGAIVDLLSSLLGRLDRFAVVDYLPSPNALTMVTYWLLLLVPLVWFRGRWKWLGFAAPLALWMCCKRASPTASGDLTITMLDVGQGECIHIRYPDGANALIDTAGAQTGLPNHGRFLAEQVVSRYLWNQGVHDLQFVTLTHHHGDHVGGYPFLRDVFPIAAIYCGDCREEYRGPVLRRLLAGARFQHAGVEHLILNPNVLSRSNDRLANAQSLVVRMVYRQFSMLLTGDIGSEVEARLTHELGSTTVLKVAHHGAASSSSDAFLAMLAPRAGVVSAGRRNPFGHPSPAALKRLVDRGVQVFTTPRHGSLRIQSDGLSWSLYSFEPASGGFSLQKTERLPAAPLESSRENSGTPCFSRAIRSR